jgi:hypothetical protein
MLVALDKPMSLDNLLTLLGACLSACRLGTRRLTCVCVVCICRCAVCQRRRLRAAVGAIMLRAAFPSAAGRWTCDVSS